MQRREQNDGRDEAERRQRREQREPTERCRERERERERVGIETETQRELDAPRENRQREREHTSNDSQISSSCGVLSYIERTQRLPWFCTWRVISTSTPTSAVRGAHLAPLAPLTRAAHARGCIRHARVTTPSTLVHYIYERTVHIKYVIHIEVCILKSI